MVENVSSCSKALPVPIATQDNGSSAITTGNPVSFVISLSIFFRSAPPPVELNPYQLDQQIILVVFFLKRL